MEAITESKYGVYRLDIYNSPGWFILNTYNNLKDALIYCDMLNQDTDLIHKVFEVDNDG